MFVISDGDVTRDNCIISHAEAATWSACLFLARWGSCNRSYHHLYAKYRHKLSHKLTDWGGQQYLSNNFWSSTITFTTNSRLTQRTAPGCPSWAKSPPWPPYQSHQPCLTTPGRCEWSASRIELACMTLLMFRACLPHFSVHYLPWQEDHIIKMCYLIINSIFISHFQHTVLVLSFIRN